MSHDLSAIGTALRAEYQTWLAQSVVAWPEQFGQINADGDVLRRLNAELAETLRPVQEWIALEAWLNNHQLLGSSYQLSVNSEQPAPVRGGSVENRQNFPVLERDAFTASFPETVMPSSLEAWLNNNQLFGSSDQLSANSEQPASVSRFSVESEQNFPVLERDAFAASYPETVMPSSNQAPPVARPHPQPVAKTNATPSQSPDPAPAADAAAETATAPDRYTQFSKSGGGLRALAMRAMDVEEQLSVSSKQLSVEDKQFSAESQQSSGIRDQSSAAIPAVDFEQALPSNAAQQPPAPRTEQPAHLIAPGTSHDESFTTENLSPASLMQLRQQLRLDASEDDFSATTIPESQNPPAGANVLSVPQMPVDFKQILMALPFGRLAQPGFDTNLTNRQAATRNSDPYTGRPTTNPNAESTLIVEQRMQRGQNLPFSSSSLDNSIDMRDLLDMLSDEIWREYQRYYGR